MMIKPISFSIMSLLFFTATGSAQDVGFSDGIVVFDPTRLDMPAIRDSMDAAGIDSDVRVQWRLEWPDTGSEPDDEAAAVVSVFCPTCAQVGPRPPRCRKEDGSVVYQFVRMQTTAETLLSSIEQFEPDNLGSQGYTPSDDYQLVLEWVDDKREVDPIPRPCD